LKHELKLLKDFGITIEASGKSSGQIFKICLEPWKHRSPGGPGVPGIPGIAAILESEILGGCRNNQQLRIW